MLVQPTDDLRRKGRAAARAAARLALDRTARAITSRHAPARVHVAQDELALAVGGWAQCEADPRLRIKARVTLTLGPEDRVRAQDYDDRLRAERLRHDVDRARLAYLREVVFGDPGTARTWWLDRHQGEASRLSWGEFNEKVLPSIGAAGDTQSRAVHIAHVLAEVIEHLDAEPGRQKQFVETTRIVLQQMGWESIVAKLPE